MAFQVVLRGVLRVFKRSTTSVSRKFQWCFKDVFGVFHGSVRGVSRKVEDVAM